MKQELGVLLFSVFVASTTACAELEGRSLNDENIGGEATASALLDEQPDRTKPYFENVSASGTGCPPGTSDILFSGRSTQFLLRFGGYALRISRDTDPVMTLNCTITTNVWTPPDMEYAVVGLAYMLHVNLEEGVEARPSFTYEFMGGRLSPRTVTMNEPLRGEKAGNFSLKDEVTATPVYSGCGSALALTIRTALQLRNVQTGNGGGASFKEAEGTMELVGRTVGRKCNPQR